MGAWSTHRPLPRPNKVGTCIDLNANGYRWLSGDLACEWDYANGAHAVVAHK